ncbi:hypothetical protein BDV26DRAFT_279166 [Aspergillus bertholletiae]|uniref:Uncharacterized protein n=1 Tax=Aspergillus bertholletiae TaxID=1226010 RepID=A0A5N7BGE7_9EURO|nr:hypothetical protein BDV26DRAFT_279166 [Aspergillus bertholletiae]
MRTFVRSQRFLPLGFFLTCDASGTGSLPNPIPAKLWRVTPSMLQAARPVDAVTATLSGSLLYLSRSFFIISLMRTDFPVPAEPVKNMLFPCSTTALSTCFCSSLRNKGAILARGRC